MNLNTTAYTETANAYIYGVRELFSAPDTEATPRGRPGPKSFDDMIAQAGQLARDSAHFNQVAAQHLSAAQPQVQMDTATAMLAKGLTDLEIGGYLFMAARDHDEERAYIQPGGAHRGSGQVEALEPYLKLIPAPEGDAKRTGARLSDDVNAAQTALKSQATDTITRIFTQSVGTSEVAVKGLVGLGVGELTQALGILGMDIAEALGQADKVTELYNLFRGFVQNAYNAFAMLLGPQVTEWISDKVASWVDEFDQQEALSGLLERLYDTKTTKTALGLRIDGSSVELEVYEAAYTHVGKLQDAYDKQTKLIDTVLPKLKWFAFIPAAALPQAKLFFAATYVILCGYVIFTAGDYLDAPSLKRFGRIPGVPAIVDECLQTQQDRP